MQCMKRSGQKVLDGSIVIAAIAVMALGAAALASSAGIDDPGWKWGQKNCHPADPDGDVDTFDDCRQCCDSMLYDPDPDINEVVEIPQCYAFCCVAFAWSGPHSECEEEEEEEDEDGE